MSSDNISQEFAQRYPAVICTQQAAEIASVPMGTIYAWSSAGKFNGFKFRVGREIRLHRDPFIRLMLSGGLSGP